MDDMKVKYCQECPEHAVDGCLCFNEGLFDAAVNHGSEEGSHGAASDVDEGRRECADGIFDMGDQDGDAKLVDEELQEVKADEHRGEEEVIMVVEFDEARDHGSVFDEHFLPDFKQSVFACDALRDAQDEDQGVADQDERGEREELDLRAEGVLQHIPIVLIAGRVTLPVRRQKGDPSPVRSQLVVLEDAVWSPLIRIFVVYAVNVHANIKTEYIIIIRTQFKCCCSCCSCRYFRRSSTETLRK